MFVIFQLIAMLEHFGMGVISVTGVQLIEDSALVGEDNALFMG